MKITKKLVLAAATAVAALTLAGCSAAPAANDSGSGDPAAGDKPLVALVSKGFQHQFWQAVKQGAEEKGAELGVQVTFDGPAAETEVDKQLDMLRSAIEKKPAAIGFAALDPEACVPLYEEAKAKDIPVVQFDAACNSDIGLSLAATDNKVAAAVAAEHMAELIGGKGEIGVVVHSETSQTGTDRRDGFIEKIEADYPGIKIVAVQNGDGDHLKSADIAKAMVKSNPNLVGIYGTNEGAAIGVVNGVNELGLKDGELTIIGFDSGAAQIEAIKNGTMAGAVTQDPIGIGATVVQAAVDASQGKTVEKFYDTGAKWYDASNIDDPEIAAVLYE